MEVGGKPARQLGLLWGFVAAVLTIALPFAGRLAPLAPACPFKTLTGWPCLSCGATRAVLALARLDFRSALAWNPLAAAAIVALLGGGLLAGAASLAGHPLRLGRRPAWLRATAIAALAANWVWLAATGR